MRYSISRPPGHPGDIVVSVREGSVDFGITKMDLVAERRGENGAVLVLHNQPGFGRCRLCLAVPEAWEGVSTLADLEAYVPSLDRPLRVAIKFPNLTQAFLTRPEGLPFTLVDAELALEVAPTIGYADVICDLVSTGRTLHDNRLRPLEDGVVISSEATLIANRAALQSRPEVLEVARLLLEYIEVHLRAEDHLVVFANLRGDSPRAIGGRMFEIETLGGLQGPTVSPVVVRGEDPGWYAVHIVVRRDSLFDAVAELRSIGGSGVVVTPVVYIFASSPRAAWRAWRTCGERPPL